MYLLKLALRPWRNAPISQVFAAGAMSVLLVLSGLLMWIEQELRPVIARMEREQVVTAFLETGLEPYEEARVMDGIRDAIKTTVGAQAQAAAVQIKLVESQEFVESLRSHYPDLSRDLMGMGNEMTGIVPRYVTVAGMIHDSTVDLIRRVPGIESTESSKDRYKPTVGAFRAIQWVARFVVIGLLIALATGLVHLSRMNGHLHRDTLSLLKLWGAGSWEVRAPGVLSGLSVGLLGGAMAAAAWMSAGPWIGEHIRALSPIMKTAQLPSFIFAAAMILAGTLVGMAAGALGTETRS